jgi:hypothetical protein
MADVAAHAVLDLGTDPSSEGPDADLIGANFQLVVHQAAGMVSVQLGISVAEALVRLRAHAFRHDRLLGDVANEVVARRLRLE